MSERDDLLEITKWYTRARKFPELIGKTPDGATLWGGPYTKTQVVGAAAVLVVALQTVNIWGSFGLIGNAFTALGAAYGTALLLGRLPIGSRNPISVASGIVRALSGPTQGTLGGAPLRIRRPHRVRSRLVIGPPVPAVHAPQELAVEAAALDCTPKPALTPPLPAPAAARPPALTGVQRLLASTGAPFEEN